MSQAALRLYLDPQTQVPVRDFGKSIFDDLANHPVWSPGIVRDARRRAELRARTEETLLDMTVQFDAIAEPIRTGAEPTKPMQLIVESDVSVPIVRTPNELAKVLQGKIVPRHQAPRKIRFKRTKAVLTVLADIRVPVIKMPSVKPAWAKFVRWGYDQGLWDWGK
jgi:hypothetical protein